MGLSQPTTDQSPPKFPDQLRAAIRTRHYSYRTELAYVFWVRRFVLFHNKKHLKDMGKAEINRFLPRKFLPTPKPEYKDDIIL